LNISKKEEKKHRILSSAGKKIVDSLTFLLFKEKKNVFFHPTIISTNFSLFLKNGKNAKKHIIQEDARPFQKNKSKN